MQGTPRFEKHLFISYAHMDNQPLTPEQQGWISRFHASLNVMLSMRLGRPAEIWRDQKLSGNDVFADEIVSQFPKTALLISVLTPRYLESDWCTREVEEFSKAVEHSGGPSHRKQIKGHQSNKNACGQRRGASTDHERAFRLPVLRFR